MQQVYLESGGDLLSRTVTSQVPSALKGLTSVFGMGTGVTPSSLPPEMVSFLIPQPGSEACACAFSGSGLPGPSIFLFFLRQACRCFHTLTTAQLQIHPLDRLSINLKITRCNQALDRLVSSSSMRYRTSTDDLSTR